MLPKTGLDFLIEDYFDRGTIDRGLAYAKQGRATLTDVETSPDGSLCLTGICFGSGRRSYHPSLWIDLDDKGSPYLSDSVCSCPVGLDCKHVVALLATFADEMPAEFARLFAACAQIDDAAPDATDQTRRWLSLFDTTSDDMRARPAPDAACLIYEFVPGQPPLLRAGKSRPLKRGGMAKPTRFTVHHWELESRIRPDFIAGDDVTVLQLLQALRTDHQTYGLTLEATLVGENGAHLLMAAGRTGRLYLEDERGLPLSVGAPHPFRIKWQTDSAGLQRLVFDLPPEWHILPTWPPHYYDPVQRSIGALRSQLPEPLFKKFLKAPPLNEQDATLVRARLESLASELGEEGAAALPLPEAVLAETPAHPPSARLRLGVGRFRHEALSSIDETYPVANLFFDYSEGVTVVGSEHPDAIVRFKRDGASSALKRDLAHERTQWARLQAVGLESYRRRLPRYNRLDQAGDCLLAAPADARGWMHLLSEGLARLEADGIQIEYGEDFPFELTQPDDWFIDLDEEGAQADGWFDLDLGVIIDGERVSLVPPLLALMRDQPQLLNRLNALPDHETLPVRLDARRILPVPVARLRTWLRPLLEFLNDDRPRLSRYQATALADLDDHPTRWLGGEGLRDLGKRLRDFTGIAEALPAPGFKASLRPYQQAGLNWLQFLRSYDLAGILADDMGLGKTVQTLAHLQLEKGSGRADRPSLVIAPTSLLPNWLAEAAQFTPDLKVLTLHGPDRDRHFDTMDEVDLILTTYPLLVRDRDTLLAREYHVLVLDEAQFIKNPKAQSHQVARKLKARHRLSLTGTPLENHLGELWAQFDFLMPGLLGDQRRFVEVFRTPIEKQGDSAAHSRLHARVAPFMLRRTKEQVLAELPPSTEIVRWVELSGAQRDLYESLRVAFDKKLRATLATQGVGRSQIMILDALLKLRQACCDPRLVKLDSARKIGTRGIAESAKLTELMTLIEELIDEGRRILLFSQFTSMLSLIETELTKRKFAFAKLTGQTRDRATPVQDFQSGKVPIFMISLKAGGTGLNLTAADTVIHYDPWWNPAVEAQATARAHRIGQDKPVFVYKLLGRGTVEEKILALQTRKRGLADRLLESGRQAEGGHLITAEDLDVLFEPLG